MKVRPYTPDDIPAIGLVHAASRRAAYAGLLPAEALGRVTSATQTAHWRDRMATEAEPHALYVAESDDGLEGFALGTADGPTATLAAIHLLPHRHGTGAGQLLHDTVLDDFRAWSCTTAELWVVEGNERAQSFYRRNGWISDGTRSSHELGGVPVAIIRYEIGLTSEA